MFSILVFWFKYGDIFVKWQHLGFSSSAWMIMQDDLSVVGSKFTDTSIFSRKPKASLGFWPFRVIFQMLWWQERAFGTFYFIDNLHMLLEISMFLETILQDNIFIITGIISWPQSLMLQTSLISLALIVRAREDHVHDLHWLDGDLM